MKRLLPVALIVLAIAGCSIYQNRRTANPYDRPIFYTKYLNPANPLDAQILRTVAALRANPNSAPLHNDLGQLLVQKGFPKDAEVEFERAVNSDTHFYPAWYNLGLIRASRGDITGSEWAFRRTIHYKPGHSAALFQLGLLAERRHNADAAINYYVKAFSIDHNLLDVHKNPRLLDSKLIDLALVQLYPNEHTRESMSMIGTPSGYNEPISRRTPPIPPPVTTTAPQSPSPQPPAQQIVPPAPPVTNPARQTPPPNPTPPPATSTH
jgi:tetratricopeptide (TPR) repeat protein